MGFNKRIESYVVANAKSLMVSDLVPRNSSRPRTRCATVVSRIFENYASDCTVWLGSTSISRENTLEEVRASHLSSPSTNSEEKSCG
ncbi:hypothetical protein TNCV_2888511 [Trichonephila clavipes]|nr:hypothetical protein TNCV_2888511 [Trichonephila clavipes]